MTSSNHIEMHRDHRSWSSEASMWRSDLAAWQHELSLAQTSLEQLKKSLEAHGEKLRQHASAIRLDEFEADAHEYVLTEYEKGGSGAELIGLAKKHDEETQRQAHDRQAHERLKRQHHTIIAYFNVLTKALTARE